jgi:uncharacterized membrane protein YgcG
MNTRDTGRRRAGALTIGLVAVAVTGGAVVGELARPDTSTASVASPSGSSDSSGSSGSSSSSGTSGSSSGSGVSVAAGNGGTQATTQGS